jgi:tetratricopeptide (TPR) repeat protein
MELARLNPSEMAHQVSTADWGALQEARVVSKQKALETYEDIVRTRIDPALLEYSGGNTFTGRVFPIQPKGYNRVIIAYEELLPVVNEHALYRFPLPNRKLSEVQVTLQANEADFTEAVFFPKEAKKETGGGRMVYSHTWKDAEPKGELVFAGSPARTQLQAISGRQGDSGPTYLYARVRPQLKVETGRPFADHAVFLLDTSLSEHPDRFAVSMKLWQQILQSDPGIKKFNILAFNVGTSWIEPKGWLDNTPEGRAKALARLDGIVLEGATDLSAALAQLTTRGANATPLAGLAKSTPLEVFLLSDGQVTWGNRDTNSLVAHFEANCPYSARFHCYTIGLGAENIELFQALTRRGGGIYPCYSEAYLPAVARAHRSHCLQVERVSFRGGPAMSDVLVAGRQVAVYPGGELVVAARLNTESGMRNAESGHPRTKLVVEGTFLGERVVYEYPIDIAASSDLAARGWGELAVSSLLALNDPKLDSLVTAYCQQFGIGSRVASFLVLENPADYKRLNLEEERGKVVPGGDLEKFLDDAWRNFTRVVKPKQAFQEFLNKMGSRIASPGASTSGSASSEEHVRKLFALLADKDFELPEGVTGDALTQKKDVSPAYLAARQADPMNVHVYLDEAKRRAHANNSNGAIRVLSSVVEAFPTRADALRLVGYRLLDMQQPAQAVRLFQQVEESRPFEPHSYRDLARSLEESGRYGFAALQYEIVLAGNWHNRFRDSLKEVAREEYAHMMQEALAKFTRIEDRRLRIAGKRIDPQSSILDPPISKELIDYFGERLEGMTGIRQQADLRVTISWNTDNTDVDLWVMEPDGTKCFYQHQKTSSGGQLSQDQTQGYGPERYQVQKALPGLYTVIVHYYRADANLLGGETHVNVLVTKHAGTPEETVQRHTVLLRQANEQVEVCKVRIN